jgi:hypothetical protein
MDEPTKKWAQEAIKAEIRFKECKPMKMIEIVRKEYKPMKMIGIVRKDSDGYEELIIRFERTEDKGLASVIQDMDPFQKN